MLRNPKFSLLSFIFVFAYAVLFPSSVKAASYYISPGGSGTSCTSVSPCSQSTGYGKLVSGDILYFKSGKYFQYQPFIIGKSGITLSTAPGETMAQITGDTNGDGVGDVPAHTGWDGLLQVTGSNVTINNLEIAYSGNRGINTSGSYLKAIGNKVHHIWASAFNTEAPYATIENNTVYRAADSNWCGGTNNVRNCNGDWPGGIAWGTSHYATAPGTGHHAVIRGNTIYNVSGEGIICMHSDYGLVENNLVYDNWAADIDIDQCGNTTVRNNLIYYTDDTLWWREGTARAGILLSNENIPQTINGIDYYYPQGHDRIIVNNIIIGGSNIYFWNGVPDPKRIQNSALKNDLIANNTSVEARGSGINIDPPNPQGTVVHSGVKIINNLLYESSGYCISAPNVNGLTFQYNLWTIPLCTLSSGVTGIGNVPADPRLAKILVNPVLIAKGVKADPSWYKLVSGSPAINKAITLSAVTTDFFGTARGTSPDIGAHEYGTNSVPTSTPTTVPTVTNTPTVRPTNTPTVRPTNTPTVKPTNTPTVMPTNTPTSIPLKPGDANADGKVDLLDYVIWLNHYGTTTVNKAKDGDFNADGKVDLLDYVIWLNNFGL